MSVSTRSRSKGRRLGSMDSTDSVDQASLDALDSVSDARAYGGGLSTVELSLDEDKVGHAVGLFSRTSGPLLRCTLHVLCCPDEVGMLAGNPVQPSMTLDSARHARL